MLDPHTPYKSPAGSPKLEAAEGCQPTSGFFPPLPVETGIRQPASVVKLGQLQAFVQSLEGLEPPAPPRGGWTVYSCLRTVPRGSQASKADAEAEPLHHVVPSPSEGEGIFGSRRRNNFQPTKDKEATFWKCAWRVDTGQKGREGTPLPPALGASSALLPILPLLWNWLVWVQRQANTPLCPEQNSEHSQSPCQGSATGQPGRWSCIKGPEQAQGPEDMLRFPNCVLLCTSMLV